MTPPEGDGWIPWTEDPEGALRAPEFLDLDDDEMMESRYDYNESRLVRAWSRRSHISAITDGHGFACLRCRQMLSVVQGEPPVVSSPTRLVITCPGCKQTRTAPPEDDTGKLHSPGFRLNPDETDREPLPVWRRPTH